MILFIMLFLFPFYAAIQYKFSSPALLFIKFKHGVVKEMKSNSTLVYFF